MQNSNKRENFLKEDDFSPSSKFIQNLYKKRDFLLKNDKRHKNIKTVLLILGGGMRGVSGGGVVNAFHSLGLNDVFDVVIGVSTGAPIGAYYLAGAEQSAIGTSIYYKDLPPRFIKYGRTPIIDVDFLESIFRIGPKKLDIDAIHSHRSKFFVAATDAQKGESVLLNAKTVPDMITAIKASTAIIGLYNKEVYIDGRAYIDGMVGDSFPIKKIINDFNPTDLLIIANRPAYDYKKSGQSILKSAFERFALRNTPKHLRQSFLNRHFHYQETFNYLKSRHDFNFGILWAPNSSTHSLTRNSSKLRALAEASAKKTLAHFGAPDKFIHFP